MWNTFVKHFETLLKDIKEELNKWINIWHTFKNGNIQYCNEVNSPQIYLQGTFFKLAPKFIGKNKHVRLARKMLNKSDDEVSGECIFYVTHFQVFICISMYYFWN